MPITVQLCPPLNGAAGEEQVSLALPARANLGGVVEELVERFGPQFRRHLYDREGRLIPAWCLFLNGRPVQLNRPEGLATAVHDGDELVLLLNVAGG